jgi:hypothetical protein
VIKVARESRFVLAEVHMLTGNINKGSGGFRVTKEKYDTIRKAILASMPKGPGSITFAELVAGITPRAGKELFPKKGSVSWYTKVVQLDLEKKGLIRRIPGSVPMRFRRVK